MNIHQTDVTGCRIIGAITKELGHSGPKHHGVILGMDPSSSEIYIAELMAHGYQATTYKDFCRRYASNGEIVIQPNDGPHENLHVAMRAINEMKKGGRGTYDLLVNNCECFVNRATHGRSTSSQVLNTAIGAVLVVGLAYVIKNSK